MQQNKTGQSSHTFCIADNTDCRLYRRHFPFTQGRPWNRPGMSIRQFMRGRLLLQPLDERVEGVEGFPHLEN